MTENIQTLTLRDIKDFNSAFENDWIALCDSIMGFRAQLQAQGAHLHIHLPENSSVYNIPGSFMWAQIADIITAGEKFLKHRWKPELVTSKKAS